MALGVPELTRTDETLRLLNPNPITFSELSLHPVTGQVIRNRWAIWKFEICTYIYFDVRIDNIKTMQKCELLHNSSESMIHNIYTLALIGLYNTKDFRPAKAAANMHVYHIIHLILENPA